MSEDQAFYQAAEAVSADYCSNCEPTPWKVVRVDKEGMCADCGKSVRYIVVNHIKPDSVTATIGCASVLADAPKPPDIMLTVVAVLNRVLWTSGASDFNKRILAEAITDAIQTDAPKPGSQEDRLWEIFNLGMEAGYHSGRRLVVDNARGIAAKLIKGLCAMRSPEEVRAELTRMPKPIGYDYGNSRGYCDALQWVLREE